MEETGALLADLGHDPEALMAAMMEAEAAQLAWSEAELKRIREASG